MILHACVLKGVHACLFVEVSEKTYAIYTQTDRLNNNR